MRIFKFYGFDEFIIAGGYKINVIKKPDGTNFSEGTLRKWIKDLAPSNKPGRRKNK